MGNWVSSPDSLTLGLTFLTIALHLLFTNIADFTPFSVFFHFQTVWYFCFEIEVYVLSQGCKPLCLVPHPGMLFSTLTSLGSKRHSAPCGLCINWSANSDYYHGGTQGPQILSQHWFFSSQYHMLLPVTSHHLWICVVWQLQYPIVSSGHYPHLLQIHLSPTLLRHMPCLAFSYTQFTPLMPQLSH